MKNYLNEIKKKLKDNIDYESLEIVDNSHKHIKHKSFSKKKHYFKLKFKASYLSSLSRVEAHQIIMKVLSQELKERIHALEISIEP